MKKRFWMAAAACFVLAAVCILLPAPWTWLRVTLAILSVPLLVGAMLLGRVFCGLLDAFVFVPGYTWTQWVGESFVTCLPGIVLQLAAIPLVTLALRRCAIAAKP